MTNLQLSDRGSLSKAVNISSNSTRILENSKFLLVLKFFAFPQKNIFKNSNCNKNFFSHFFLFKLIIYHFVFSFKIKRLDFLLKTFLGCQSLAEPISEK